MKKKIFLFIIIQLLFSGLLLAQPSTESLAEINLDRIQLNSNGMLILGGWAVSNIIIGGVGMTQSSGNTYYFHQMNAAWNTVNLAIAGFGYYGLRNQSSDINLSETIFEFQNFEKILLFNAGLDVGYMAIGTYLWERGLRKDNSRLTGYGQSMILQGGFLFAFDLILYFASNAKSSAFIESLNHLQFTGTGLSLYYSF